MPPRFRFRGGIFVPLWVFMKFRLGILFLFFGCFVALPTSGLRACGNENAQYAGFSGQSNEEHCGSEGDACVQIHPGQDCPPDTDGCGHCHCPGCGVPGNTYSGFLKNDFPGFSIPSVAFAEPSANFSYQVPSSMAHLTALFRPPIFFLA